MAKPTGIEKSVLLTAVKQSLVEKGIEKFTLKVVAEQAGVTQGTIYLACSKCCIPIKGELLFYP
ncbi:TetR/AcrR family transcriptional regulator [Lysinibacillus sp. NPDC056959]|uniref:TetR/AcrR family transcriptional regulator n=1 Tax=Lysinibacillus sp. NPDC056959 TaxID=3345981 RepID=UPI00362CF946